MNLIINNNRKITPNVTPIGTYGTQNENKVTELTFEIPEEYQDWNKRIVFITSDAKYNKFKQQ